MKNLQGTPTELDPTSYNISWLEQFLRRTRRRYWMLNGLSAVLEATMALALFAGILAVLRTQVEGFPKVHIWWWAGVALAVMYVIRVTWQHYKAIAKTPIAEQVEGWNPRASGFLTALELGRDLPSLEETPMYSATLSQARIDQVASMMRTIHPMEIVPFDAFRRRAYSFLGVAVVFFGLLVWMPRPVSDTLGALFYPPTNTKANPLLQKDQNALVVGDLKVTYRYPAYSGKGIRALPNSDGSLSALRGTRVTFQARSLFPIKNASLHLNHKTFLKLRVGTDKRSITGQLDLLKPGFYRFVLNGTDGSVQRGPTHPIQIQPDKKPKVKLLSPKQDLDLQAEKSLRLAYRFSDDFGVSKVYLVYQNKSSKRLRKPERKLLQDLTSTSAARNGIGEATWDLQSLPFSPGDRVAYYIEVHDNDTISGPNKGRSEVRHIKLFSPLKQHQKMVKAQEALLGKMTLFLADLIEAPTADKGTIPRIERRVRKLNRKGKKIIRGFDGLIKAMRQGSLTQPYTLIAMENLRIRFERRQFTRQDLVKQMTALRKYSPFLRGNITANRKAEIPPQEDDVYAFSLMLNRQQLDLLTKLARQLSNAQNRLRDLLEKYRKKKDPETKRELLRQMDRVEKLISEIHRRMSKMRRMFSEGFFNMKAFRKKGSLAQLRGMKKDIESGNLENAAKRLAKLALNTEKMVSQMDKFAKEAGGQLVSRMNAAMKKMINDLQQLEQKQRRLSRRTEKLRRKLLKRMQKALKGKLDAMLKKQLARAKQIEHRLKSIEATIKRSLYRYRFGIRLKTMQKRIQDLKRLLKHKDVFESLDTIRRYQRRATSMESSLRYLQQVSRGWRNQRFGKRWNNRKLPQTSQAVNNLQETQEIAKKIEKDLARFFPSPKPYMKPQDKALMKRYQQYQKMLRKEASQLEKKLKRMAKRMPMFKPKMIRKLSEAAQEMRQASKRLGDRLPKPAHGHQQKAIQKLQQCQNGMRQSMKPQGRKNGKGKKGKQGQGQGGGRRGDGRSTSQQKVKIPKPGEHKAPKALRQDILDAMKEKLPHRYRQPVRKYYEKLVK